MGIAPQLNTTYISPRLAARLDEIEHCRLTTSTRSSTAG